MDVVVPAKNSYQFIITKVMWGIPLRPGGRERDSPGVTRSASVFASDDSSSVVLLVVIATLVENL